MTQKSSKFIHSIYTLSKIQHEDKSETKYLTKNWWNLKHDLLYIFKTADNRALSKSSHYNLLSNLKITYLSMCKEAHFLMSIQVYRSLKSVLLVLNMQRCAN